MSARTLARLDADDAELGAGHHPDAVILSRMFFDPSASGLALADRLTPSEFPRAATRDLFGVFVAALAAHRAAIVSSALFEYVKAHAPACVPALHAVAAVPLRTWEDPEYGALDLADHVAQFRDWSRRTRLAWTLEYVSARGADDNLTAPQVEALLEQRLAAYRAGTRSDRVFDDKAAHAAEALAYLDLDREAGLSFGFSALDAAVFPARPGQLLVIGGAPGTGKSTFARNIIRNWLLRRVPVAALSVEMSGAEWLTALACAHAGLDAERYERQAFTPQERADFHEAIVGFRDLSHFALNEQGALTPSDVLRHFARYRGQFAQDFPDAVPVFVLDHFHRIDFGATAGPRGSGDVRHQMGHLAKGLKTFAKDHECIVLVPGQYRKLAPGEVPTDDLFKESNALAEEADKIFHVYRPLVAHECDHTGALWPMSGPHGESLMGDQAPAGATMAEDERHVYVKLGKQRAGGRRGIVRIPFDAATGRMGADAPAPTYRQLEVVA